MDKFEYKVRAEEIKSLIARKEYVQAAEIADTIDWRRVKSVMMLCTVSDLYKINRRYEDARDMLLLAYDRHPGGRTIVYSLCELYIKTEEIVEAVEYYKEFIQIAPRDTGRYILQYKLYEAQEVSLEERIAVLEELKQRDYREKWAYELAYLYHRVGLATRCVEECDELILWFGDGKYVFKAMELKMLHQPLTLQQQQKYESRFQPHYEQFGQDTDDNCEETSRDTEENSHDQQIADSDGSAEMDQSEEYEQPAGYGHLAEYEQAEEVTQPMTETPADEEEFDIHVNTMDVSQFNTINLQKELAEGLKEVLGEQETLPQGQETLPQEQETLPQEQEIWPEEQEILSEELPEEPDEEPNEEPEEEPEEELQEDVLEDSFAVEEEEPKEELEEPVKSSVQMPEVQKSEEQKSDTPAAGKFRVRNLTREEKELFGTYAHSRSARQKLVAALDKISLAAYTGNVIVTGDEGMDTLEMAKNIIRDVQMNDSNFSGKTAKISGIALNQKDVYEILEQLKNGALIIQKISDINENTAAAIYNKLQQESLGIIIVIEDTRRNMNKFLAKHKKLEECFNARVDMEAMSNEELVAFGKKYAREMEYSIDELGVLALHTRIEEMQTLDHAVTVMEVRDIIDEAIQHANRKSVNHFLDLLLAKRYDEEDMIILRESDFI